MKWIEAIQTLEALLLLFWFGYWFFKGPKP